MTVDFFDTLAPKQKAELTVGFRNLIASAARCGVTLTENELGALMQARFEAALTKELNANG